MEGQENFKLRDFKQSVNLIDPPYLRLHPSGGSPRPLNDGGEDIKAD